MDWINYCRNIVRNENIN
ncbi:hypothetical protein FG05_35341 [Fusarium graminearum]|nr:hypothetical protein FG05_35341 [Fusarium graminearum]